MNKNQKFPIKVFKYLHRFGGKLLDPEPTRQRIILLNFKCVLEIKHHFIFCWWSILNSNFKWTLVLSCSRHYKAINNLNTVKMLQLDPAAELSYCSLLEFIICWQKFGLLSNSYIYPGEGKNPAYNFTLAQYCRVSKLCNYALCDSWL